MGKAIFKNVVIAGIGLMGGSLGLALKKYHLAVKVSGLARRSSTIKEALGIGAIDKGSTKAEDVVKDADLIVFAGPVLSTPVLLEKMLPYLPQHCLLTDMGSTKAELMNIMNKLVRQINTNNRQLAYIGSHPMAGSEKTGVGASIESLYLDSACVLVKGENISTGQIAKLKKMWRGIGCKTTIELSGKEHDALTALVSHLPHAVAVGLTSVVKKQVGKNKSLDKLIGTGFRDTTRIAAGSPAMWVDIFLSNKKDVTKSIEQMQYELEKIKQLITKADRKALIAYLQLVQEFKMKVVK